MRGSFSFLGGALESIQPRLCRPRTLDEESMEYQRDLFVEVGRGHEDSMQVGRVEAPSRPNCTDELSWAER